jgi:histidine triad (HIT) family protein
MTNSDCLFCKIVRKEIPAEIVYETESSLAFLDINPVHEGHTLLIPKKHSNNMLETDEEVISSLFKEAKKLMISIKKAMNADFVVLTVVGTDVPHFHIHLIPRFEGDGLAGFWPAKKYASNERRKEVAEKIREINKD